MSQFTPLAELITLRAKVAAIELYVDQFKAGIDALYARFAAPGDPIPLTVGQGLRIRRESLGLSQSACAEAVSLSRSAVSEIERGTRRSPETVARLADTLTALEQEQRERFGQLLGRQGLQRQRGRMP